MASFGVIPVEVKGEHNEHYPGYLTKVGPDGVFVAFNNQNSPTSAFDISSTEDLKSANTLKYAYESVRFTPRPLIADQTGSYRIGDVVEVWLSSSLISSSPNIEKNNSINNHLPLHRQGSVNGTKDAQHYPGLSAWWEARVTKVTPELLGVDIVFTKDLQSSKLSEIVEKSQLRPKSDQPHLTLQSLHSYSISVTPSVKLNMQDNAVVDFVRRLKGVVLVDYDEATNELKFVSPDMHVIHRVKLLEESFIRIIQQKHSILSQKFRRSEDRENSYSEIFSVESELIGMAIGYQGRNIVEARAVPGIINITLDDNTKTFYVYGKTKEAVKEAREKLEFMRDIIQVPQAYVSRLIGRNGVILQEVVDKSQVIRVYVAGDLSQSGTTYVFPNGIVANYVEDKFPFQVVGRRSQLEDARLLIEYNIDMFRHIDEEQGQRSNNSRDPTTSGVASKENSLPPMPRRGGPRGRNNMRGYGRGGGERGGYGAPASGDESKYDRRESVEPSTGYHTDSAINDRDGYPRYSRGARGERGGRGGRGRPYRQYGDRYNNVNGNHKSHENVEEEAKPTAASPPGAGDRAGSKSGPPVEQNETQPALSGGGTRGGASTGNRFNKKRREPSKAAAAAQAASDALNGDSKDAPITDNNIEAKH